MQYWIPDWCIEDALPKCSETIGTRLLCSLSNIIHATCTALGHGHGHCHECRIKFEYVLLTVDNTMINVPTSLQHLCVDCILSSLVIQMNAESASPKPFKCVYQKRTSFCSFAFDVLRCLQCLELNFEFRQITLCRFDMFVWYIRCQFRFSQR